MGLDLKRLGRDDVELARRALARLKVADVGVLDSLTLDYLRAFLAKPENILVAAIDAGVPVGFALAYLLDRCDRGRPMMLFYEIGVAESHRRRGIGRALVEWLKAECARRDAFKMWVPTHRTNTAAVALFEATGGTPSNAGDEVSFRYDFQPGRAT
jgi:GNAT superfamily N-acetyltransferase